MKTNVRVTSLLAYHGEVSQKIGKKQKIVMEIFEEYAPANLTNSEVANLLHWPINTVTPRVYELRRKGKIAKDEHRRCGVTGRTVIAWRIKNDKNFTE